jgi:hypothetical protein
MALTEEEIAFMNEHLGGSHSPGDPDLAGDRVSPAPLLQPKIYMFGIVYLQSGLPDFSWYTIPKLEKCTRWS